MVSAKYRRVGQFKGFLFLLGLGLVFAVFFYTSFIVEQLRQGARESLALNIQHYLFLLENASPTLAFEEIKKIDIPIILTGEDNMPKYWKNVGIGAGDTTIAAREKIIEMVKHFDRSSSPMSIEYGYGLKDYIHYGDTKLINQMRYIPYLSVGLIGLFILIGYMGFKNIKDNEQSSVWVGMARETAHQLGTPISSLLGWMELLKSGGGGEELYPEMEKDIMRLGKVAGRFSQIGSEVKLETVDLAEVVKGSVNYYKRRIPQMGKRVVISENFKSEVKVKVNVELLEWALENLIRNSIDAITTEEGKIEVTLDATRKHAFIDVADNGCGIELNNRRNVFRPGYTTKKRGWGVGLSLSRRIIRDYHGGKLTVKESIPGQGTTMRITIPI